MNPPTLTLVATPAPDDDPATGVPTGDFGVLLLSPAGLIAAIPRMRKTFALRLIALEAGLDPGPDHPVVNRAAAEPTPQRLVQAGEATPVSPVPDPIPGLQEPTR